MSNEDQQRIQQLAKEAIHLPFTILSSLAVLAIAGWIAIAVSDHFDLKTVKSDVADIKPKVDTLWYQRTAQTKNQP